MHKNLFTGMALALALVSVAHAASLPMAKVRLEIENLSGNPISSVMPGDNFRLTMFAQDIRTTSPIPNTFGVFAAYTNVSYDPSHVILNGPVTIDPYFSSLFPVSNTATPGQIDAGGSSFSLTPPGSAEQRVFSVPLHATSAGSALFISSFSNSGDFLLYGYDLIVLETDIQFLSTSVVIVPEPSSFALGAICSLLLLGQGVWKRQSSA